MQPQENDLYLLEMASWKRHLAPGPYSNFANNVAICMGQGKNYKYFQKINEQYQFFDLIIPLPHPRWVMQYRRKHMETFVKNYVDQLNRSIQLADLS